MGLHQVGEVGSGTEVCPGLITETLACAMKCLLGRCLEGTKSLFCACPLYIQAVPMG